MLKGIPSILLPELLKILMEMGHADEILLADGNYPTFAQPDRVIHLDGHGIPEVLAAVLQLMPLDTYVEQPAAYMAVSPGDSYLPTIWETYTEVIQAAENRPVSHEKLAKLDFYERGRKTYAVIRTGEQSLYANLILRKGVVSN